MDFFDATKVQPAQGGEKHPAGMFNAQISNTYAKSTKDQTGGMFVVELTTDAGRIEHRYNLWNQSAQAVEIAQKELSALCHATGVFRINFPKNPDGTPNFQMAGAELRGARCRIEVAPQKNNPEYNEVKRVFDVNGNEPGKSNAAPQPQPQQNWQPGPTTAPPANTQPQGWGNTGAPAAPNAAQPPQQPGWGNTGAPAAPNAAQPPQPQPNAAPGWQQPPQNSAPQPSPPPWARS